MVPIDTATIPSWAGRDELLAIHAVLHYCTIIIYAAIALGGCVILPNFIRRAYHARREKRGKQQPHGGENNVQHTCDQQNVEHEPGRHVVHHHVSMFIPASPHPTSSPTSSAGRKRPHRVPLRRHSSTATIASIIEGDDEDNDDNEAVDTPPNDDVGGGEAVTSNWWALAIIPLAVGFAGFQIGASFLALDHHRELHGCPEYQAARPMWLSQAATAISTALVVCTYNAVSLACDGRVRRKAPCGIVAVMAAVLVLFETVPGIKEAAYASKSTGAHTYLPASAVLWALYLVLIRLHIQLVANLWERCCWNGHSNGLANDTLVRACLAIAIIGNVVRCLFGMHEASAGFAAGEPPSQQHGSASSGSAASAPGCNNSALLLTVCVVPVVDALLLLAPVLVLARSFNDPGVHEVRLVGRLVGFVGLALPLLAAGALFVYQLEKTIGYVIEGGEGLRFLRSSRAMLWRFVVARASAKASVVFIVLLDLNITAGWQHVLLGRFFGASFANYHVAAAKHHRHFGVAAFLLILVGHVGMHVADASACDVEHLVVGQDMPEVYAGTGHLFASWPGVTGSVALAAFFGMAVTGILMHTRASAAVARGRSVFAPLCAWLYSANYWLHKKVLKRLMLLMLAFHGRARLFGVPPYASWAFTALLVFDELVLLGSVSALWPTARVRAAVNVLRKNGKPAIITLTFPTPLTWLDFVARRAGAFVLVGVARWEKEPVHRLSLVNTTARDPVTGALERRSMLQLQVTGGAWSGRILAEATRLLGGGGGGDDSSGGGGGGGGGGGRGGAHAALLVDAPTIELILRGPFCGPISGGASVLAGKATHAVLYGQGVGVTPVVDTLRAAVERHLRADGPLRSVRFLHINFREHSETVRSDLRALLASLGWRREGKRAHDGRYFLRGAGADDVHPAIRAMLDKADAGVISLDELREMARAHQRRPSLVAINVGGGDDMAIDLASASSGSSDDDGSGGGGGSRGSGSRGSVRSYASEIATPEDAAAAAVLAWLASRPGPCAAVFVATTGDEPVPQPRATTVTYAKGSLRFEITTLFVKKGRELAMLQQDTEDGRAARRRFLGGGGQQHGDFTCVAGCFSAPFERTLRLWRGEQGLDGASSSYTAEIF